MVLTHNQGGKSPTSAIEEWLSPAEVPLVEKRRTIRAIVDNEDAPEAYPLRLST